MKKYIKFGDTVFLDLRAKAQVVLAIRQGFISPKQAATATGFTLQTVKHWQKRMDTDKKLQAALAAPPGCVYLVGKEYRTNSRQPLGATVKRLLHG